MRDRQLLFALSVSQFVAWGSCYYAYAVLMEPMRLSLGISRSSAAGAYSFGLLVMGFVAIPVGLLIDRGRHFPVLIGGTLTTIFGMCLHSVIQQGWQLYAVWALIGAGMAATLYEPVFAFLIRTYPDDFRSRITLVTLLGGLASTVFWPLTTLLLVQIGWRSAFIALAVLQVFGCLFCLLVYLPRGDFARISSARNTVTRKALSKMLRSRPFLLLTISFMLQSVVLAGLVAHIIGLLSALGAGAAISLAAAASIGVMQVVGRILLLAADSRLHHSTIAKVVTWFMPAAALALLLLGISPWLAFLFAFLFGAGNGLMTIVKGTATADLISKDQVGILNGVMAPPLAIGRAIGPVMVATIWDSFDSPRAPVVLTAVLATAGALALLGAYDSANKNGTH